MYVFFQLSSVILKWTLIVLGFHSSQNDLYLNRGTTPQKWNVLDTPVRYCQSPWILSQEFPSGPMVTAVIPSTSSLASRLLQLVCGIDHCWVYLTTPGGHDRHEVIDELERLHKSWLCVTLSFSCCAIDRAKWSAFLSLDEFSLLFHRWADGCRSLLFARGISLPNRVLAQRWNYSSQFFVRISFYSE